MAKIFYQDMPEEPVHKLVAEAISKHHKGKPLNEKGQEVNDPTPMEPPLGYRRTLSLAEQIRQQIMIAKAIQGDDENESFDDADDFEVGDDYDPSSPYEQDFDPMSDADKKALSSQGRDVDGILGPKPKPPSKSTGSTTSTSPSSPEPKQTDSEAD